MHGRIPRTLASLAVFSLAGFPMGPSWLAPAAFGAQDVKGQEEAALGRITQLYLVKVELQLEDLARHQGADPESLNAIREAAPDVIASFLEEHPVKLLHQGSIAWSATPIKVTPYADFADSSLWSTALVEHLDADQRELLAERYRTRQEQLQSSLQELIAASLTRGLVLTLDERQRLAPLCEKAAIELLDKGVLETFDPYGWSNTPKDRLRQAIDEDALVEALTGERKAIAQDILKNGRTSLHDMQLEAEFLLEGHDDQDQGRRILRGFSSALLHRDGAKPKPHNAAFHVASDLKGNEDWAKILRSVLGISGDLPELPSHSDEELLELRALFLLNYMDLQACFSPEQREDLLPLLREFVDEEGPQPQRLSAKELYVPASLGLKGEDRWVPGQENRFSRPSTKVKALIKTLFEACTQAQQDVLKS